MVEKSSPVADNPFGTSAGQGIIAPEVNPTPRMDEQANPEAWAKVGQAVQGAGNVVESEAQKYGELFTHTAVNDQYVNGFVPQVSALESDFKKLSGTDAIQQEGAYKQKLQAVTDQYMNSGSLMQRQFMGELVARRSLMTSDAIGNHADEAFKQHANMVDVQSINDSKNQAAQHWQNPDLVDADLARVQGLATHQGERTVGLGDAGSQAVVAQQAKDAAGDAAKNVITMALDNHNTQMANGYYQKYQDLFPLKDRVEIEKSITHANLTVNSSQIVDNLFTGSPIAKPGTPLAIHNENKANITELAQKEKFDPNVATAIAGMESDFGAGIKSTSPRQDVFQTDKNLRDKGYEDDSLASSVHNGAKIYNENSAALAKELGRTPSQSENFLAYNQGGAGAHALLTASPSDTAVNALAKIMPYDQAKSHVLENGGNMTMAANEFSTHVSNLYMNHYDSQKVADGTTPSDIRGQSNVSLPAMQPTQNGHEYFEQMNNRMPAAQATIATIPDDELREAATKKLDQKFQQAKLADTVWKNQQADIGQKIADNPRYTTLDQVPVNVKNDLRAAGQLGGLEKALNDKNNPKKDNTYGSGFLSTFGRLATDDKVDQISDLAGLQKEYGDNENLHSSGFKQLSGLIKNADTAEGKARISGQYQFLSDLHDKMVAGAADTQGQKNFEKALPGFFRAYNEAEQKGNLPDVLSFDPKNKNSFIASLNLPSSADMTSKKINNSVSILQRIFGGNTQAAPSTDFAALHNPAVQPPRPE